MQEDDDYKKSKIKIGTWKKIFKVVAHSRSHIIKLLIFSILLAGVDSLTPLLNRFAIEHFLNDNPDFSYISTYIILYSILIVFFGIIVFSFIKEAGTIEALTSYHLRKQAFDNLQRLPFSYYDKNSHGWLMARMTSDSRKLSNILSWGLLDIIWTLFSIIIILIILFITYWKLALVFLVVIPIMGVVSFAINKRILKHNRAARSLNSQVTAGWNESFSGAKTTKTLNIENKNLLEFGEVVFNLKKSSIRAATVSNFFVSIMLFISYATVCFLLVAGGVLVVTPDSLFKIGTLYMFIQYTQAICDPMMQLSRVAANLQSAQASAERIVGLIETKPTLEDSKEVIEKYGDLFSPKQENYEEINGDIEVRDVSFSYKEGENILEHFNLKIKAGQSIALVGHTGSGKSTLVNLISRFYEPVTGQILIDGVDYKERSIHFLHKRLGYVLQSPVLFSTTIMENIRYGNFKATDEEIINASKLLGADEFISKLEKGYDSYVGEGGNLLSNGQKQLLSFVRAIIADPRILILDEATSSVDSETEKIVQNATSVILKGRTNIIVAHRLSTIVSADTICMMENGKIIEIGTHSELLSKRGAYFELYKAQFMQEKEEELVIQA